MSCLHMAIGEVGHIACMQSVDWRLSALFIFPLAHRQEEEGFIPPGAKHVKGNTFYVTKFTRILGRLDLTELHAHCPLTF